MTKWIHAFCFDVRASFATSFSLLVVPLVLMAGMASQYMVYARQKATLQYAADAAALAATGASGAYLNRVLLITDEAREEAQRIALRAASDAFQANVAAARLANVTPTITSSQSPMAFSVNVAYSTMVPGVFSSVMSSAGITISGQATASYDFPPYIDIYVLLDTSSSMGLGATPEIQDQMRTDGGLSCVFGCHVNGSNAYDYARSKGYRMRIDVLRDSLRAMVQSAISQAGNQSRQTVRIGLFTFSNEFSIINPPTYDLETLLPKIDALGLAPTGGGTDFYNAFRRLRSTINRVGDGRSATSPRAFVFLITDGVEDGAMGYVSAYNSSNQPIAWNFTWDNDSPIPRTSDWGVRPLPRTYCDIFKTSNTTVSVLYTKYTRFDTVTEARESNLNNNVIPRIPSALYDCSSGTGNFYQADRPEDIGAAIQTMFSRATAPLRLSQ